MLSIHLPEVAIVGRPNVGKSTLYNRILGRRQAIVARQPGVTRDRQRTQADWSGRPFLLTDTGGMEWNQHDELPRRIQQQAMAAVEGAQVVLMLVDGREGLVPLEEEIARLLHQGPVPVVLVINKCDTRELGDSASAEFWGLGIRPMVDVSAEQGRGIAEMLDLVVAQLPQTKAEGEVQAATGVAVVGRPNVGKSSLVNALLGSDRVIVSDAGGTTRDAIDSLVEVHGNRYRIIDTAGIRRGGKRDSYAEVASVAVARRRMQGADVALLLADAGEGVTRQDLKITAEAERAGCGLILVINKWDTIDPEQGQVNEWVAVLRRRLGRMSYALVAFTSALYGDGVEDVLPLVQRVQENRARRIPTGVLNAELEKILERRNPDGGPGMPQPRYITQVGVNPPTLVVFTAGGRRTLRASYVRYIENSLRGTFELSGTPIVIRLRRATRT